ANSRTNDCTYADARSSTSSTGVRPVAITTAGIIAAAAAKVTTALNSIFVLTECKTRRAKAKCAYINVKGSDEAHSCVRRDPVRDRDDVHVCATCDVANGADARYSLRADVQRRRGRHAEAREDDGVGCGVRPGLGRWANRDCGGKKVRRQRH